MSRRVFDDWPLKLFLVPFYLAAFFLGAWGADIVKTQHLPWYGVGAMVAMFLLVIGMLCIATASVWDG